MDTLIARAGRWPLALMLWALAALAAACSDETVAPRYSSPKPGTPSLEMDPIQITVTNASGGYDVGSIQWAVAQINQPGPTGVITFDPSLDGATITLDAPLDAQRPVEIIGPAKGITLSGNDQHRVINSGTSLALHNVTLTKGNADFASAVAVSSSLALYNTTIQGNHGTGSAVFANSSLQIVNSTVSGNVVGTSAVEYGQFAYVTLDNSTIAYNAPGAGFGPAGYPQSLQIWLRNSILSNNGNQNCSSFYGFNYVGKNISSDWSCGEVGITVADPLLLPLAKNGGPNMTHAIPYTSPAFNSGVACLQTTDQRYVARDAKCDVGAFEFNDFTKVTLTIDQAVKFNTTTKKALLTGTITCTRNEAFRLALELHQNQKISGQVVDIHSATDIPVTCTTTPKAWSASMGLAAGEAFQSGAARATAVTFETADWVAPASVAGAVKISVAKK
jgi:hypothetical protein